MIKIFKFERNLNSPGQPEGNNFQDFYSFRYHDIEIFVKLERTTTDYVHKFKSASRPLRGKLCQKCQIIRTMILIKEVINETSMDAKL